VDYDGCIYRILELYGCRSIPNEGIRWTPEQQFAEIAKIEKTHPWLKGKQIQGVADPAIWDRSRGPSIADTAAEFGIYFTPGDHARIPGWMQCHYRLQFDENGYARCYIFENCKGFIRTIPLMMYDKCRPEDLDSSLEDHIADEWRYLCMSRPVKQSVWKALRAFGISNRNRVHRPMSGKFLPGKTADTDEDPIQAEDVRAGRVNGRMRKRKTGEHRSANGSSPRWRPLLRSLQSF
jgi:hypothetical protein